MMKDIEYGCIHIKLKEYMEEHHITRTRLGNRAEMQRKQVKAYMDGTAQRIDLGVMSRICHVLECRIEDLLVYEPYVQSPPADTPHEASGSTSPRTH